MREIVGIEVKVAAPASKVWDVIASVGGVDKWSPVITACRVEGSGKGTRRFCTMADGTDLKEVVDEVDHAAMRFRYRITEGMPVEGYEGTLLVNPLDGGNSKVTWYSTYSIHPDHAAGFRQMILDAYAASLNGLEKYCQA